MVDGVDEQDPEGGSSGGPTGSVSLDDVSGVGAKPNVGDTKLEGDDVPEELRGKSPREIAEIIAQRNNALRLSESARLASEATVIALGKSAQSAPAPAPAPVPEPVDMPANELAELMQTDPGRAVEVIQTQLSRKMSKDVNARLGPLASGATGIAETNARTQYPEEFQLFGDQIKAYVDAVPDKSLFTNPKAWDDLVSYIRGRPDNFQKLFDFRNNKTKAAGVAAAQAEQRGATGFTGEPARTAVSNRKGRPMDSIEREIARELGMDDAEYIKWRDI